MVGALLISRGAGAGEAIRGIDNVEYCEYTILQDPCLMRHVLMDQVQLWERNHSPLLRSFHIEASYLLFSTIPDFESRRCILRPQVMLDPVVFSQ